MNYSQLEPVRLIGYVTTALVVAAAVAKQVYDSYDEGTGWLGLGLAVLMATATEMQRNRVTPVAKLDHGRPDSTTTYGG